MNETWYGEGLRFECTRCGDCCRGEPGFVWVNVEEASEIARFLGVGFGEFERMFLRRSGRRMSLVEKENGDCIFWTQEVGCKVYEVRPLQCRTFPFWRSNLADRKAWNRAARRCPGMDRGRLYSAGEIEDTLKRQRW